MPFHSFYAGKRVLVTGDTGFKGAWLASWLKDLGADVHGLGLEPGTDPALFTILRLAERVQHTTLDIRHAEDLRRYIGNLRPDVVFHLAAQAIVRLSYQVPLETLETNVMGTANLLYAIGAAGYTPKRPCTVVAITSDKCYENRESYYAYREEDPMGGHDVYSMSKGAAELVVASWRRAFYSRLPGTPVRLASCRAGNVIGGGDWAPDRVVADAMRAMARGEPIPVRNPRSIRPWQHVLEPLSGYLQVGAELGRRGAEARQCETAWNFGPGRSSERTVGDLCDAVVHHWGGGSWVHTPEPNATHEAVHLKLSIDKAAHYLGWQPAWEFDATVRQTVAWYRAAHDCRYDTDTMRRKTHEQIQEYMRDAAAQSLRWTGDA
jgi:CDP-glucose 4,6-dehydratase